MDITTDNLFSQTERSENNDNRSGMALLVSLLLLALLSGLALQSLVASGMELRFARDRHVTCLMRTAATDAVLSALLTASRLDPDSLSTYEYAMIAGPDIETRTSFREVARSSLPPPLLLQNTPLFGRFFAITTRVTLDKLNREIRALACLTPTGELRLLSWTEPL